MCAPRLIKIGSRQNTSQWPFTKEVHNKIIFCIHFFHFQSKTFTVISLEPPKANINFRRSENDQRSSLTCYNSGLPKPKIVWYYNFKNVKFQLESFMQMRNLLYVKDNQKMNGVFTCVAVGLHGKTSMSSVEFNDCETSSGKCSVVPYVDPTFTTPIKRTTTTPATTDEAGATTDGGSNEATPKKDNTTTRKPKSNFFYCVSCLIWH
jgi:hypothetical protein